MKQFKFIIGILLFLFSYISSTGTYKYPSAHKIDQTQESDSFAVFKIAKASFYDASLSKDLDVHYKIKKKVRFRATTSQSCTLKTPYYSKLVNFIICKTRLIYGIATLYQVERHTHLHLYQLF
ncbi:hypothetical protein SD960_11400 [Flavobacterium sp. MMLR14_040]|jgi:hypothetical protein|uniref:hypothetical protein n=1 Tax=Flavobacterium sp. MMLR14_040 TaxID=3093843 RepID=UPI00298F45A4|nr:hypothetical protein [Flavobacterium sp. MMLR14_040]MDW8850701.1 hypothetical protein [Flavobacterium sp. MMLR14_040]